MSRLSKIGAACLAAFGWSGGVSAVSVSYLVVAGGGGGGGGEGAGGGAGGYRESTTSLNPTLSYTVTVGAGGAAGVSLTSTGVSGGDSTFSTITSTGGGGGGTQGDTGNNGLNGGSGGGAASTNSASGASGTPGTGVSGQGFAGGAGYRSVGVYTAGGGGGGATVAGTAAASAGGAGGTGATSSISGTSTGYAGGGGGGSRQGGGTATQGGGAGSSGSGVAGTAGTTNTGGGGGGGRGDGGKGGSGIVIISYTAPQKFGGGVVTTSGSNVIHTFNTSGTLTPLSALTASALVVGGGGAGGGGAGGTGGGGGGAGGYRTITGLTIDTNSIYLVTVGAGGAANSAATSGSSGTDSFFSSTTSTGGGGGGYQPGQDAKNGGSGGGAGSDSPTASSAGTGNTPSTSPSQGSNGGTASNAVTYSGGGGGGASQAGSNGSASTGGGKGGDGSTWSVNSVTYAGGGGGGRGASGSGTVGAGGTGGGGTGSYYTSTQATAGTANLGGGGGGGSGPSYPSGAGGSGVVIISYAGSTQQMAGGTVTISGGNVIHTFTSSGYLTPIKLVNNSLRFRSSNSAYLSRTFVTPTNNYKFTFSAWVKRGSLPGTDQTFFTVAAGTSGNTGSTPRGAMGFDAANTLSIFANDGGTTFMSIVTTAVFRDPAAWYHVVYSVDTTQATSTNRVVMYVNGVSQTASGTYPSQNQATVWNGTSSSKFHGFGFYANLQQFFDGYLTEINFIDGQALTPSSFGTINSYGVWQPITYGGSYGTNGFYLPFTNNTNTTTIGYDFSPNGNNWTSSGINVTAYSGTPSNNTSYDSMTDVPTLTSATAANYAVWNPLDKGAVTVSDGNLTAVPTASGTNGIKCSIGLPLSGKFYWEITVSGLGYGVGLGIANAASDLITGPSSAATRTYQFGSWFNTYNSGVVQYGTNQSITGGTNWSGASQPTGNDVIIIAVDMDNGSMWVGKNGTWFNSSGTANPATNTDPRWTSLTGTTWFPYMAGYGTTSPVTCYINFGQRPFSYTPPTGYVALNTYNM